LFLLDVAQHNKTRSPKSHIILSRNHLALNSLSASALILTLLNPLIVWDVRFLLSFVATQPDDGRIEWVGHYSPVAAQIITARLLSITLVARPWFRC
jgi:arginine exporter protein ArgO